MEEFFIVDELLRAVEDSNGLAEWHELDRVSAGGKTWPILGITIGSRNREHPCLGLFAGVHGLEKIGTHVVVSTLDSLLDQLHWDRDLQHTLEESRIVAIPIVNPGGMALNLRANPNGVDLMRNAPVEADVRPHDFPFLISGHRLSSRLPWYRGQEGAPMELESQALMDFVRKEMFPSRVVLGVDFHSGFGVRDRFWFPYARSREEFPRVQEVEAIKRTMDETLLHHVYVVEPQSFTYLTHGDLWDFLFDEHRELDKSGEKVFIPFTVEMGSWNWVKKNPKQIFSAKGLFNPIIEHRYERTLRRHQQLIEFLFKMVRNPHVWSRHAPPP